MVYKSLPKLSPAAITSLISPPTVLSWNSTATSTLLMCLKSFRHTRPPIILVPSLGSFLTWMCWSVLEILRVDLLKIPRLFSLNGSVLSLVHFPKKCSFLGLPRLSVPSSQIRKYTGLGLCCSSLHSSPENFSRQHACFVCFLPLSIIHLISDDLETVVLYVLSRFNSCFKWKGKVCSCYSILAWNRTS